MADAVIPTRVRAALAAKLCIAAGCRHRWPTNYEEG